MAARGRGFDRGAMMTHLSQVPATKDLPQQLASIGIRTEDYLPDTRLSGIQGLGVQPGRDAELWRKFKNQSWDPVLQKQIEKRLAAAGIKPNFTGNVSGKGKLALQAFLKNTIKTPGADALDNVMSKGFRGRPVRGGAAGLITAAGGWGLKEICDSYRSQQAHRTDAQNVLEAVRAELDKRKASGG